MQDLKRIKAEKADKKLTGKQLFEKDENLFESDLQLLNEDAIEVDESLFQNLDDLDLDDDDISEQSFFAYRPHFWFAVIVLLQGLCFQFYLNPVLTTMYEMTSDSILWYKGIIGIEPTVIQNITEVEVIVPVPSPPKKVTKIVETQVADDSASAIDDT